MSTLKSSLSTHSDEQRDSSTYFRLRGSSGALVTHYFATGQPELLAKHLQGSMKNFVAVYHPFSFSRDAASMFLSYFRGTPVNTRKVHRPKLPEIFGYVLDLLVTVYTLARSPIVFDLFIGADALNAFAGLILKKLGRTRLVILYSIDLPLRRFGNPVPNLLYHKLNIFCARKCDATWDLSPRMHLVRKAYDGGRDIDYPRRLIVPSVYRAPRCRT